MKNKILIMTLFVSFLLIVPGCTKKPDVTINKFSDAVNNNDASAAGKLISEDAENYSYYESNNWSGLKSLIGNWRLNGTMSFSGLSSDIDGSDATVTGYYSSLKKATLFKMTKKSDFLFFSYSWRIKNWQYDTNHNNSAADDPYQIQKVSTP